MVMMYAAYSQIPQYLRERETLIKQMRQKY